MELGREREKDEQKKRKDELKRDECEMSFSDFSFKVSGV